MQHLPLLTHFHEKRLEKTKVRSRTKSRTRIRTIFRRKLEQEIKSETGSESGLCFISKSKQNLKFKNHRMPIILNKCIQK